MPVSIITSQARSGAISFHRATCSTVLRQGLAGKRSAASPSSGPTPWSTTRLTFSGKFPSASASAQVETKKSRQPASISASVVSRAPSP